MICPQCKSTKTQYYNGTPGYEAIKCHSCHQETDLHDLSNWGIFECNCQKEGELWFRGGESNEN